ncbi:hypothetical protein GCM10009733_026430 [Nonomuraea maheshkhaliensis]|uniref:Uncharacterized protein n=1 Tax=Nonomuraea maheshkhaliensis TaxID=419590 RepID=A0ABP4QZC5_9ACTN
MIEPAPEGRTELVSALRGHDVAQAAKCLIVMVKGARSRAGRLDRSVALVTEDYVRPAAPRVADITAPGS